MNKPCIIFDIDGTIANCDHRKHFVEFNFEEFENRCGEDTPYEDVIYILRMIALANHSLDPDENITFFACSGRQDKHRATTEAFLKEHQLPYTELFMRPTGDCRKDSIVKGQMLDYIKGQGYDVRMAFDDRQQVVDMWRERGITCAQVREWVEGVKQKYSPGHLTLMVGPSGAGKSTYLHSLTNRPSAYGPHPDVFSSDLIRAKLCGTHQDQSKNDQVFAYLHAVVKARIEHGIDTTVDATNLRNKDRLALVDLVPDTPTSYIVIDRPLEEKLKTRDWRTEELVRRHDQLFKSNLKYILNGDGRSNVVVHDKRTYK